MIYNTLLLSASDIFIDFVNSFKKYSQNYTTLDYINTIKEKGIKQFEVHLKNIINQSKINLLIIQLDRYDASIDINFLNAIQKEYHFKLICIFQNSQNTFEFIDRYYAQLANLIIIDDTPYIDDFYTMLQIPFLKIDYRKFTYYKDDLSPLNFNISHIEPHSIFTSALSNLSQIVHTNYYYNKYSFLKYSLYTQKYFKQCQMLLIQNKINHCFSILEQQPSKEDKIFIDEKFKNIQNLYSFYWTLYSIIYNKNYKSLFNLISLNSLKNGIKIYKLYRYLQQEKQLDKVTASNVLNILFYKSYKL